MDINELKKSIAAQTIENKKQGKYDRIVLNEEWTKTIHDIFDSLRAKVKAQREATE